jgi:ribose/xylose/arabinose/galactoside ABC-type transport system permease subunit
MRSAVCSIPLPLRPGVTSVAHASLGILARPRAERYIIAVLGSGLAQVGGSEPAKRVITGGLIVAAVILDHYRQRLRARKRRPAPEPAEQKP